MAMRNKYSFAFKERLPIRPTDTKHIWMLLSDSIVGTLSLNID